MVRRTVGSPGLSGLGALLPVSSWNDLLGFGAARHYRPGRTLMSQGGPGDAVHVLVRGRVQVRQLVPEGIGLPLAVRYPGEVLGEIAVLRELTRTATVTAIDPCDVRVVPAPRFRSFVATRGLGPLIAELSYRRLQEAERLRTEQVALPFIQRLCRMLVAHAVRDGRGDWAVDLHMSQEELGLMCGGRRDSMSRALRTLREEGIVTTARRVVVILDMSGLRHYAHNGAPAGNGPSGA
ncbi:Crp/Fnr family transcriptional regulator [Streptomyces sp. NPDC127098]|uniref:Crp/Fnr family transcriptional regulator n=1 Tax=Streptomyces sp. NPDC127098 TaxID=3347137 RepID=UPI0036509857